MTVSVDGATTDGDSFIQSFSADGTLIAFTSTASNLAPTDTNETSDVYVSDLTTGEVVLVSANAEGSDSGDDHSSRSVLSADATKIAFVSQASDLGPNDVNGEDDVYVRDLTTGDITLISANAEGTDAATGEDPVFSPDGTKIAFISRSGGFGPADLNGEDDIYVRDLATGSIELVSHNAGGTSSGNAGSIGPKFSPDGTKIAFTSSANDFGPPDADREPGFFGEDQDVYVRDLATDAITLVSVNSAGTNSGDRSTGDFVFHPDGSKIAFASWATDVVPGAGTQGNVFLRDLTSNTTSLVSVSADGSTGAQGITGSPIAFSPDGTKIAFSSLAGNFGPTDDQFNMDLYVRDLAAGTTYLASTNATNTNSANGQSTNHEMEFIFSTDSTKVLFRSTATDLGPTDTNGFEDLYVRDLAAGRTTLVSMNADGSDSGNAETIRGAFSSVGVEVAFSTVASNLGPADPNGFTDIYLATLR